MSIAELRERAYLDAVLERFPVFVPPAGWWNAGACRGLQTSLFFGRSARDAAAVCKGCSVKALCLLDALHTEQHVENAHDIFGRRWLTADRRDQILAAHRTTDPERVDGHDDTALMVALCDRIRHNLTHPDDQHGAPE